MNALLTEISENILTITINRPDRLNALNMQVIDELGQCVAEASADPLIRGIIITGAGHKAFVAGADISEFAAFGSHKGEKMSRNGHRVFNSIERCPKPVVAAINGFALGGGCELAMACHLRIASENARFGQPEINLGIIPGYGGTQRLVRYLGRTKALELLLTGEMITAQEAYSLGLVNMVVTQEELRAKCRSVLQKILEKSPLVTQKILTCVQAYYDKDADGFEVEIEQFAQCFETEDFKEGTKAFLEKRKPSFTGR